MRTSIYKLIACAVAFTASLLSAQSATTEKPDVCTNTNDTVPLTDERQRKFDFFFYEAQRQQLKGNHDAAYELLSYCHKLDPQSAQVLYELSNYYLFLRNDARSLSSLEKAVQLSPDNYWYQTALVQMYVKADRINDALKVLNNMAEQFPDKSEVLMMLIDLYSSKTDFANVIKTLDKLETKEGKSEQLSIEKFKAYVQLKDEKNAFREMKELADEYPNDLRYKVLIGDLYLDNGKSDEALKVYKAVEKEDPENPNVALSLASYYEKTGNDSLGVVQLEKLITNNRIDEGTRFRVMQSLSYQSINNSEDSTKMLRIFKTALSFPQKSTDMAELCARYMVARNMPADSVKPVLRQMLSIDPENELARNQLLSYALEEEDTIGVIEICKPAVDYSASNPVFHYYLGVAYFQQGNTALAIEAFRKGLDHVEEKTNLTMITNMYSILGDLYHDIGEDTKAFEAYDSCLIYRPDDALVLNNYAYYLSLKKQNLDKAAEMSLRSMEQEKENPTYIDTYAWILFQQKKYVEAKEQIDKALSIMGDSIASDDANVVEHAGDIYYKAGLKEEALSLWQKALELGGKSEALEEKVKKKKYIE